VATEIRRSTPAAGAIAGVVLTIGLIASALVMAANPPRGVGPLTPDTVLFALEFVPLFMVGGVIASLRTSQPVGWLLVAMGLAFGAGADLASGGRYLYGSAPATGALLELASNQLFKLVFVGAAAVLLLFPDGKLPSPRWRWLLAAIGSLAAVGIAAELVLPGPITDFLVAQPPANPLAVPSLEMPARFVSKEGFFVFSVLLAACAFSLVLRYRRGGSEERLQLRWFALAAVIWAATAVADGFYRSVFAGGRAWPALPFQVLYLIGSTAMAAGIGIAILRHRLFDVDAVIVRTLSFGTLATLITIVYLAVVIGLGAVLAAGSSSRLLLAVAATALIAVAFQPMRARLDRFAKRLVYGPHAVPYESLAALTLRLHRSGSEDEDPVAAMAKALAQGTACDAATVWDRETDIETVVATWPAGDPVTREGATRCAPVLDGEGELGLLAVRRLRAERLTPTEERLMDNLAVEAGLVLKNRRLQRELRARLDELEASRQRLVFVQDEERRRLERDLHDGAQQDLVALRMKLGLAGALARQQKSSLAPALDEMQRDLGQALDALRSLARGVYPPLLEAEGLRPALSARARPLPFSIELDCDDRRYPREIEGAVYFCCSEALQNVVKHAKATRVWIQVGRDDRALYFEVRDDGRGSSRSRLTKGTGLRHIRDRLEALGGSLEVVAVAGTGTTVRGWLPLPTA
jgi:signal transduction histidine kinase